jgi:hypothetical protein
LMCSNWALLSGWLAPSLQRAETKSRGSVAADLSVRCVRL